MLTERGWLASASTLVLTVLWYMVGERELGVAASILAGAVVFSLLWVWVNRPRLTVSRQLAGTGVHEGDHAGVILHLRNDGRRLRQLVLTDEVRGLGTAEFAAASIGPGEEASATYRVMCRPRGLYTVGPSRLRSADPLGLAARQVPAGRRDALIVYPAVEPLDGLPSAPGRTMTVSASRPDHGQRGGEDFYTLREYHRGDDLRRVHWPSSAHRDRLMIRQLETPWQARAVVFLDLRQSAYPDSPAFERAVSGAASVLRHLIDGGFAVDIWWGGSDIESASTYHEAMTRLAIVEPSAVMGLAATAVKVGRGDGSGLLVAVTGRPDQELADVGRLLARSYPNTVLMASVPDTEEFARFRRTGAHVVAPDPGQTWAEAWARTVRGTWQAASVGS